MAYIKHHSIVITALEPVFIKNLIVFCKSIDLKFIGPSKDMMNDYRTICIPPDGSKEGWEDSQIGDRKRELLKRWLKSCEKSGIFFDWVEVSYSPDNKKSLIVDDAWGCLG